MAPSDKILSVKDCLLLKIKKHMKYKICVMDLVSLRGITLMLFGRPVIQLVCLFDLICLYPFILWIKFSCT